ncbi:6-phosphogluconolactonase [Pullulanibacillus sp. KACC 23026]|uniref:6-phosphogluconolactonase n=1 Tax=Pullulanibacillus sp. KACC 23026 TaxID=3028315 RepID=UPI0023AFA7AF|nr:6-phosphogluconolactonase [Pullulanibacillus sp. KACC 23026]WEG10774.1 6-phosphogluconolactonase [Pullulanibacillus sp. KACC 23026]
MLKIYENEEIIAQEIAKEMKVQLQTKNNPVFCLASGSTPQKSYFQFAQNLVDRPLLDKLKIVSLDEWVGIPRHAKGSCYQMLEQDLFSLININEKQIEFFNGEAEDLKSECQRIDQFILNNPITFSLMGVGMNGHIGLNEPGSTVEDQSRVVPLSETTKEVAQKYFDESIELTDGITLGLKQIIESSRVIVVITGEHKARMVKQLFEEPEAKLPAQELLGYQHIDFFLDQSAAKELNK